jgi:hypothetical protein
LELKLFFSQFRATPTTSLTYFVSVKNKTNCENLVSNNLDKIAAHNLPLHHPYLLVRFGEVECLAIPPFRAKSTSPTPNRFLPAPTIPPLIFPCEEEARAAVAWVKSAAVGNWQSRRHWRLWRGGISDGDGESIAVAVNQQLRRQIDNCEVVNRRARWSLDVSVGGGARAVSGTRNSGRGWGRRSSDGAWVVLGEATSRVPPGRRSSGETWGRRTSGARVTPWGVKLR